MHCEIFLFYEDEHALSCLSCFRIFPCLGNFDDLILELEAAKKTAPLITITLAAPATKDVKQALVSSCRSHIADDALVTFKFNSSLCGGMVLQHGSRVFDWSFRRQILANRTKFTEVLRSVR